MAEAAEKDPPEVPEGNGGQTLLFIPKFEGVKVTDFTINVGGNIAIGDPELIKRLTLGEEVTLRVKAHVQSRGHRLKAGKDNADKKAAVSSANIVVDAITLDEDAAP